ncbi:TlyA family rRNA (cytidine-2'-O)-methyltransferase [Vagococcus vulneris]|uniref:TlyA family rRNA (Cytidine-2'-O)-methyltransferase n=1 Tax=Vagococcus vulneris TaxID=1977869 RepID=A0A429ZWD1_9ENTE|nr:TlyA family RNA methyltransferase [Vagococcus vulneris]RST98048.1 TlyA family rRNA (cytidine-2'-O)-methyltransferase [Vagococcus vulneris]
MSDKIKKERVDVLVTQQGLTETREKAKRAIMAGLVYDMNNLRYDKPGEKISQNTELKIKGKTIPYVSRGGLKLEKAMKVFNIDFTGKILLDIGSSTGGFTDCALQNGARMSYALDVGSNQLAWKLRQDERVHVMEKTNFRYSVLSDFKFGQPDMASIDVSFISLKLILPVLKDILKPHGQVVALIKPQFEAGREQVGKKGIIRDKKIHLSVLETVLGFIQSFGYNIEALDYSPITGGDGNIEFLAYLKPTDGLGSYLVQETPETIVSKAHEQLTHQ